MDSITERHGLNPGDLVEIAIMNLAGTRVRYGEFRFEHSDGSLFLVKGDRPLTVPVDRIRYVKKVTAESVAAQYTSGQRVVIHKYGSDYSGIVVERKRTRVVVQFTTRGGKVKTQTVPAVQLDHHSSFC